MEDETLTIAYKEELLRLAAEKNIKHTAKYIENASEETLKKSMTSIKNKNLKKWTSR